VVYADKNSTFCILHVNGQAAGEGGLKYI